MNEIEPFNQTKLFGLKNFLNELIQLYNTEKFPTKILFSGQKGLGKSTMAYHFINYVLSKNEDFGYDIENSCINPNNHSYKTILNKSNPNVSVIDIDLEKKNIDINQIRNLILNLNKSSFNDKLRFVLIDNIEFMNINSVNAILKILEEPSDNTYFILINNNKRILPTLLSRCVDFKIFMSNSENLSTTNKILDNKIDNMINTDLINYYSTPGKILNLIKFAKMHECDLININIKEFINFLINNNHKTDNNIKYLIYDFIEFYFSKINLSIFPKIHDKYNYFIKRISDTKKFNLDEETLFIEFKEKILDG